MHYQQIYKRHNESGVWIALWILNCKMKERKERKKIKGKKGIMSGPYCFLIESHDNGHIGWINIDKKYPNTKERKKEQVLALHCLWILVYPLSV